MPSFTKTLISALAITAAHALPTKRADTTSIDALIATLITSPSHASLLKKLLTDEGSGKALLTGDALTKASIYNFNENLYPLGGSNGGAASGAARETFPLMYGSNLQPTIATVGPCGVLAPHVHPRANEWFTVIEGELRFGYMNELGVLNDNSQPLVNGTLTKYTGTLFPQGAIHYQQNPTCSNATAIATLGSDDAGTTTVLFPPRPENGTGMGAKRDLAVDAVAMSKREADDALSQEWDAFKVMLPWYIVDVAEECRARCGLAA